MPLISIAETSYVTIDLRSASNDVEGIKLLNRVLNRVTRIPALLTISPTSVKDGLITVDLVTGSFSEAQIKMIKGLASEKTKPIGLYALYWNKKPTKSQGLLMMKQNVSI